MSCIKIFFKLFGMSLLIIIGSFISLFGLSLQVLNNTDSDPTNKINDTL